MPATQKRYATLGDLTFGGIDPFDTRVYLKSLKGWDEGSGSTGSVEQRAADHGGWPDQAYMPPRVIELELVLAGSSFQAVSDSIARIAAGLPLNTLDTLLVDNHGNQLQAQVRQSGDFLATQKAASATASLALLAPDPRRYSTDEISASTGLPQTSGGLVLPLTAPLTIGATISSGRLVADNAGNVDTLPTFTITGPCPPGATITHLATGAALTFAEALGAGHSLVIDTAARTAVLDGTAYRTVTGVWFAYTPGANEVSFTASGFGAGALLTSVHRSAWR